MLFPEPHMQGVKIVDIALTSDFFIYITDVSYLTDWIRSSYLLIFIVIFSSPHYIKNHPIFKKP